MKPDVLSIAEIPYDTGELRFRYSRYLSEDGRQWMRHGLFRAFHRSGALASEGEYEHGTEMGIWRDYHENGRIASEGEYRQGEEHGVWRFWLDDGTLEKEVVFFEGQPVDQPNYLEP